MNLKVILPILMLMSFATPSFCADQVITVGTLEDYAPFCQKIQDHEPVNQANFLIYVRKFNPIKWRGLQSLDGLNIGVKRGFNYGDKWKATTNIQKHSVSTILQGFKMLDFKRLD